MSEPAWMSLDLLAGQVGEGRMGTPVSDEEQAILDAACIWADAVDAYESACRREHEPWRAYPEATGRVREERPGYVPCSDELAAAARRARDAEDALRAAVRRYTDGR